MITIEIEIVYLEPVANELKVLKVSVAKGSTVAEAIDNTAINIDLSCHNVGIFGRIVAMNTILNPGDRVEIYPNLLVDPKILRKQRVEQTRT